MGAKYVEGYVLDDIGGQREVVRHNAYIPKYADKEGTLNPKWVISKKELYKLDLSQAYKAGGKPILHFTKGLSDPIGFIPVDKEGVVQKAKAWALAQDEKMMKFSLTPPVRENATMWMVICIIGIFAAFLIGYNLPAISHILMNLGQNATSTTTPPIYTPHG
jgi:hypothetical protein